MKNNIYFIRRGFKDLSKTKNGGMMFFLTLLFLCLLGSSNFFFSLMIQKLIDASLSKNTSHFFLFSALFLFSSIAYGVVDYTVEKFKEVIAQKICKTSKSDLLNHILRLPLLTKQGYGQGRLLALLSDDTEKSSRYLTNVFFPAFQLIISLISGVIYILYYSWIILIVSLMMVMLFVVLSSRLSKRISQSYSIFQGIKDTQKDFFQDVFRGADIIKIYSVMPLLKKNFDNIYKKRYSSSSLYAKSTGINYAITEGAILMIELSILLIGILFVKASLLSVAVLIGIWNASIGTLIYPFMDFPAIVSQYSEVVSSWERCNEVFSENEESSKKNFIRTNHPILVVKNLSFNYPFSERILHDINLTVKKGELIVIEGESGTGKSTLINLILQLLPVSSGKIAIKDDADNIYCDLRSHISYVPQLNTLLDVSILENLKMGEHDGEEIQVSEIKLLLRKFNLPIEYLYDNKKTNEFSLGEVQRFSIIRGLLKQADFMLMDEPFSSLDDGSICCVVEVINKIKGKAGVIIITHRHVEGLSADKFFRLCKGELNEI